MKNYYISSFAWSTAAKIINAVISFFSIPLLLKYYGEAEYGVLSIATACNTYMHLLDLGMNTGAVKYYSQWRHEGKAELIQRVARTNISFYLIIAIINALVLFSLGRWGEPIFSITHSQFEILRKCLYIIAAFSVLSWGTTTFNQLLISYGKIAFTMQMQCIQSILKLAIIFLSFGLSLSVSSYFLLLTAIVSLLIVPYVIKCYKDGILRNLLPDNYWSGFKTVMIFSLSIFSLSLFQMTANQSRPIILGIFADNAANVVAEYRILEVLPMFVIQIGLTFGSIFLPKTSEIISRGNTDEIRGFAYQWTLRTTLLANILCIPCVLCAKEFLILYVGSRFAYLDNWLILWSITALLQIHTTPMHSLIVSTGKTRLLVITSAVSCVISIVINIMLSKSLGIGSAIIGYLVYVCLVIISNYLFYYKSLLGIDRAKIAKCLLYPTLCGALLCLLELVAIHYALPLSLTPANKFAILGVMIAYTTVWGICYFLISIKFKWVEISAIRRLI